MFMSKCQSWYCITHLVLIFIDLLNGICQTCHLRSENYMWIITAHTIIVTSLTCFLRYPATTNKLQSKHTLLPITYTCFWESRTCLCQMLLLWKHILIEQEYWAGLLLVAYYNTMFLIHIICINTRILVNWRLHKHVKLMRTQSIKVQKQYKYLCIICWDNCTWSRINSNGGTLLEDYTVTFFKRQVEMKEHRFKPYDNVRWLELINVPWQYKYMWSRDIYL